MNTKLPFQVDLKKLNLPFTIEEIDGYVTDFELGEGKIKLFKGGQSITLIVKQKNIYDSSSTLKIGEYL